MIISKSIPDTRAYRKTFPSPIGFVPTMGFLHAGHMSLVQRAVETCSSVVVSIFVNPSQFAPHEDLSAYPRDLERDLTMLESAGIDLVWIPTPEVMYPEGYQTWVDVEHISKPLEGGMRPGHFRGVATIVAKLFNVVQPDIAFFGQKDAQQVAVIRRMVSDLNFPLEIIVCPIVRESDGLAMSSRNVYLNPAERRAAPVLSRSLNLARKAFESGEKNASALKQLVSGEIAKEPLARLQYVSCADSASLDELNGAVTGSALLSLAAYFGSTRLIDNIVLEI